MKNYLPLLTLLITTSALQAQNTTNLTLNTPNSNFPGQFNTLVGPSAGSTISTANENVFVGYAAGISTTAGSNNVFVGVRAGNDNTGGQGNTLLGYYAGRRSTNANANSFIGGFAGEQNTTGAGNTFVGYYAGNANTTGFDNAFLGSNTGQKTTTGSFNTFMGQSAGSRNDVGGANVFVGHLAGNENTSGNFNVFIGQSAGQTLTTGYNNVLIGSASRPVNPAIHDAVAIGGGSRVALDNAIVLGNPDNTSIAVGIGTDSPQFPLDVRGTINLRNNGRIKFAHLSNPLRDGTTDQFLTVNEAGETVLARHRLKIDHVNQWSDKVFSSTYSLRPLTSVAAYINQHGHLPGVPSAEEMVKDGLDLVRMNATLLEKVEELTLYSIEQQKEIEQLKQFKQICQRQQARMDTLEQLITQGLKTK